MRDGPGELTFNVVLVIMAMLIATGCYFGGRDRATRDCQQEAIKAGVGRWSIDEETGERKFVYGVR